MVSKVNKVKPIYIGSVIHTMDTTLLDRFPCVELSYETFVHKKVYIPAIVVAIPYGVKHYLWITFGDGSKPHTCYSLELNRAKKIVNITELPDAAWYSRYSLGTVLYGTWVQSQFVVEDVYYYRGIYLRNVNSVNRLKYLYDLLMDIHGENAAVCLAQMFVAQTEAQISAYKDMEGMKGYTIHHLQVRHIDTLAPYLNLLLDRNGVVQLQGSDHAKAQTKNAGTATKVNPDFRRPQYRLPTVFYVRADIQPDIYSLYTVESTYYGVAHIPSYQISIYMNSLFRRIRENACIETAEDSEDEADFENTSPDKFVDLTKQVQMECSFSLKFKKWVPMRVVFGVPTVPMRELIHLEKTDIKKPNDEYKQRNVYESHRRGEVNSSKTPGRGGELRGQYKRNSRSQTQFSTPRGYSSHGYSAHETCRPERKVHG